jgi:hypothetical protein
MCQRMANKLQLKIHQPSDVVRIMKRSSRISQVILKCVGGIIILTLIGYFAITRLLYPVTGEPYSDNAGDRTRLTKIAASYEVVCNALRRHHSSLGVYPATLDDLDQSVEGAQATLNLLKERRHTVHYQSDRHDFTLHVKLNWDGGLHYQGSVGQWRYDPGNGEPDWPIR